MDDVVKRIVSRDCPVCGGAKSQAAALPYGTEEWPMVACGGCGFVFLTQAPIYERLSEEFAWEKTSQLEREAREIKEPIKQGISRALKEFRRNVLKRDKLNELLDRYIESGPILDIGCAGGGFLQKLAAKYEPHGVEVSRALAAQAEQVVVPRGGSVMHDNALNGIKRFPDGRFSGVVMSSFLEHEIEPAQLMGEISRVLRPGGKVIIKVPNYASWNRHVRKEKWCGFRLPDHVNYFTPESLRSLVTRYGLEIVQFSFADKLQTSDNMWMVAGRP